MGIITFEIIQISMKNWFLTQHLRLELPIDAMNFKNYWIKLRLNCLPLFNDESLFDWQQIIYSYDIFTFFFTFRQRSQHDSALDKRMRIDWLQIGKLRLHICIKREAMWHRFFFHRKLFGNVFVFNKAW